MRILPVGAAFNHAIQSTLKNIGFAFHVSWPWMLVLLPLKLLIDVHWGFGSVLIPKPNNFTYNVPLTPFTIFSLVAFASIAVSWHRFILFDEVPQGLKRFRLDKTVWSYAGNTIAIFVIFILSYLVFLLASALAVLVLRSFSLILIIPGGIALAIAAVYFMYRLSLKLPAIAVGRENTSFKEMIEITEGNFWPLTGFGFLYFLCAIALAAGFYGLTYVIALSGNAVLLSVFIAVQLLFNWLATIFAVTMLTSLYGFFVEQRDF